METKTPVSVGSEEKGFELLKEMILRKLGLNCSFYRDSYLQRRINFRMRALGVKGYWDYVRILRTNFKEYSLLIRDITVNYTKFFRDADVYSYFEKTILPQLLANKKTLRILSAGCSSGEEPYTIGMILHEVLGPRINEYVVSIYAIDIDDECLKKAQGGVYEAQEVSDIGQALLDKYFRREEKKYLLKDEVKRLVHFSYADLTQQLPFRSVDLIFCRNVFIYFNKTGQAKVFENFYEALQRDAYLIIGKTEMLPDDVRDKFSCIDSKCRVFKKNDAGTLDIKNTQTLVKEPVSPIDTIHST